MRHTVLKAADGPVRGALWCTWFSASGVLSAKVTTSDVTGDGSGAHSIDIDAHGWIGATGSEGTVDEADGLRAHWKLAFRDPEPAMFHLPRPWMYRAPLPKTKSMSATPLTTLGGSLTIDGEPVDVDGWPCTIGHNWGTEHAERWIWIHADAAGGGVWLDVVIGRVRLGPVTTPWIGNGAVSVNGRRHRLGGLRPGATRVVENARGATVTLQGSGITVVAIAEIELSRCVAWSYADPAGHTREVVNSSVARTSLTVERRDQPRLEVTAPVSAFELGAPERAFDVPLQPFPD